MDASMTPERWSQVKGLLGDLLTMDTAARRVALDGLADTELRRELEAQLAADLAAGDALLPTVAGVATDAGEPPPEVLAARYRIVRPLGRGGMGTVDLAHDLVLDCPVAIKRLRDVLLPDGEARRRLRHEGRALAALNHPHVARVQDVLDTTPPALVMEYVEGRQLSAWAAEADRQPGEVLDVLRQVVEAVAYAHRQGVVHCDLKPANVIVTPEGAAKVVDFGIALMTRATVTTVVTDSTRPLAFTPRYAAPEVKLGATPTPASDVYSLGVLVDEVLGERLAARPPWPGLLALQRVAERARALDAPARFRDAGEMRTALAVSDGAVGLSPWRARAVPALVAIGTVVGGGLSLIGDGASGVSAASMPPVPVLAVVARVDDASSKTVSAAAADILRRSLGRLERARLVTDTVPTLKTDVDALLDDLKFEGLTHVLVPTVTPVDGGIRVSVAVRRSTDGLVVKTATRAGPADALDTLTRGVAADLRDWLGEPRAQTRGVVPQLSARSAAEYSQAMQYVERPDRADALTHARALLESVTRRDVGYAPAHAELARVLVLAYRARPEPVLLVQARNAVDRALAIQPTLADGRLALASVYTITGRREDANIELRTVLAADPTHERALRLLGQNEAARGNVDQGIATLQHLIALHPSWPNYRALGTLLFNGGRNADALVHFRALTELQPDNPWGFQMLGAAHHALRQLDEAVRAYETSLRLSRTASALTNLATVHYERGNLAEAERRYAEAAALEPADPVFHRNLADVQWWRGRKDEARVTYGRAVEAAESLLQVDRGDLRSRGNAVYAAARQGACTVAMAHAAVLEPQAVRQITALANLANAYALCGRYADARSALARMGAQGATPASYLERDVLDQLRKRSEFAALLPRG